MSGQAEVRRAGRSFYVLTSSVQPGGSRFASVYVMPDRASLQRTMEGDLIALGPYHLLGGMDLHLTAYESGLPVGRVGVLPFVTVHIDGVGDYQASADRHEALAVSFDDDDEDEDDAAVNLNDVLSELDHTGGWGVTVRWGEMLAALPALRGDAPAPGELVVVNDEYGNEDVTPEILAAFEDARRSGQDDWPLDFTDEYNVTVMASGGQDVENGVDYCSPDEDGEDAVNPVDPLDLHADLRGSIPVRFV